MRALLFHLVAAGAMLCATASPGLASGAAYSAPHYPAASRGGPHHLGHHGPRAGPPHRYDRSAYGPARHGYGRLGTYHAPYARGRYAGAYAPSLYGYPFLTPRSYFSGPVDRAPLAIQESMDIRIEGPGIPTSTGIRAAPVGAPTLYVIDAPHRSANRVMRAHPGPRIVTVPRSARTVSKSASRSHGQPARPIHAVEIERGPYAANDTAPQVVHVRVPRGY